MGSIGAISAFGSQAMQQRLHQSKSPKALTALEFAEKIRMGPVGKTEQQLHLEKAKEMALQCEAAAFEANESIINSEGATVGSYENQSVYLNSHDFSNTFIMNK